MNKVTKAAVIASVAIAPAFTLITPASAQVTTDAIATQARWGATSGARNGMHDEPGAGMGMRAGRNVAEDAAAFLNTTVEEVKAARENGIHIPELVTKVGKTIEEWQAYRQTKMAERLTQAVADGKITAEQAELMQQRAAERHAQMMQRFQANQ